jgi:hypothetical protein
VFIYINYDRIWLFFSLIMGLRHSEIQSIMKIWLEETYDLTGLTPILPGSVFGFKLEETYDLTGLTPTELINTRYYKV